MAARRAAAAQVLTSASTRSGAVLGQQVELDARLASGVDGLAQQAAGGVDERAFDAGAGRTNSPARLKSLAVGAGCVEDDGLDGLARVLGEQ